MVENKWEQKFHEKEANQLHDSCTCPETDGTGDCPWCQIYYWGWGCEGCGLTIPTCQCDTTLEIRSSRNVAEKTSL